MATITGYTAEHMLAIENATIVTASLVSYELILTTKGGTATNLGNVRGATGAQGATGPQGATGATGTGLTICTSATRPASPAVGQNIYETDTGKHLVYYGATTSWRPPWANPWGYISFATTASAINSTGNSYASLLSWSGTPLANRRYLMVGIVSLSGTGAGNLTSAIGNSVGTTDITQVSYSSASGYYYSQTVQNVYTTTGSAMTKVFQFAQTSGTGPATAVSGASLLVQDIGPATATPPTP